MIYFENDDDFVSAIREYAESYVALGYTPVFEKYISLYIPKRNSLNSRAVPTVMSPSKCASLNNTEGVTPRPVGGRGRGVCYVM